MEFRTGTGRRATPAASEAVRTAQGSRVALLALALAIGGGLAGCTQQGGDGSLASADKATVKVGGAGGAGVGEQGLVEEPVEAQMDRGEPGEMSGVMYKTPQTESAMWQPVPSHDASLSLDVRYTEGQIYNPMTRRYDQVKLRSYVSSNASPHPTTPFVAPTISVRPGETVRIKINNKLPDEGDCMPANINTPHCFNSTNLHAHGLWVSPAGNSDNVLVTVKPGVSFEYEYNIPSTHPAGTYWYHPHLHGATAVQLSSGMAGALIIRGTRTPTSTRNGDIDTLLRDEVGRPMPERLLLMQQVQYACRDANGAIKTVKDATGNVVAWNCEPGDVGTIEKYDQFGGKSWVASGRYTTVNGQVMPRFPDAVVGRLERWRAIHAGVRNTINLQFRALRTAAPPPTNLRSLASHRQWIEENCIGPSLTQWEIAGDGLTHHRIIEKTQNPMQPGYRSDVLMAFPAEGEYCVIDAALPAPSTVGNIAENRQVLGTIRVRPGPKVGTDVRGYVTRQLTAAAQRWMPAGVRERVVADLANGLRLGAFVPHADVTDAELTGTQTAVFNIVDTSPTTAVFMIDGKPYTPSEFRTLILGSVEEWTVTSQVGGHPFHIHVNPFQVVKILNPQGEDVSVNGEPNDPQYANLKGMWKDTLFVKQGYRLILRTRYERYIGEYVLHCHTLDHEDQGMMQNVRVVLPDGHGGAMIGGHGGHGGHGAQTSPPPASRTRPVPVAVRQQAILTPEQARRCREPSGAPDLLRLVAKERRTTGRTVAAISPAVR